MKVRLWLIGDGPERSGLEQECDQLGLRPKITFFGARGDVPELLAAGDGFVMSSRTEGLPMALLEAMAAGLPCVATAVGGIPELFAENRGLLAPPQDPQRLAEQMGLLVRDRLLRVQLASNAVANVRAHYSLDAVADQYLGLLGLPPQAAGPNRLS